MNEQIVNPVTPNPQVGQGENPNATPGVDNVVVPNPNNPNAVTPAEVSQLDTTSLGNGLPPDAVILPGEPNPEEANLPPPVDEALIKELELKAENIANEKSGEQDPANPAITDPNQGNAGTLDPGMEQRFNNMEAWMAQQINNANANPTPNPNPAAGVNDIYNQNPNADVYTDNPQTNNQNPNLNPTPAAVPPQLMTYLDKAENWMETIDKRTQEIEQRFAQRELDEKENEQKTRFKERYPTLQEGDIDKALILADSGDLMGAFTFLDGKSRVSLMGQSRREVRAENRGLAGQSTNPVQNNVPGGAAPPSADAVGSARQAYKNFLNMNDSPAKDQALSEFMLNYGEMARTIMAEGINGPILDAVNPGQINVAQTQQFAV